MSAPALLLQAARDGSDSTLPSLFIIVALLVGLVFFVIYIVSLVWVYRDAERHGKSGIVVALLVALISWPIGLLVWLLVRDKV
jgi:high-affinity K+ transport system ATPase subunit B